VLKKGMLRQVNSGASVSVILHLRISWPSISDCSFHDMMPSKGPRLTFARLASQLRLNLVPHLESLLVGSHHLSHQQAVGVGRFGNSVSQQEAPAVLMHDRCRAKAGPRGTVQVGPGNAQDMQQIIGCNLQTAAADRNRFPKELHVPPRFPANRRCLECLATDNARRIPTLETSNISAASLGQRERCRGSSVSSWMSG
jgi:hypothetical protein